MGLITVDPSQKKTVVALIGILVVAVGVTIVRIEPATEAGPANQQQSQPSAGRAACSTEEAAYDRLRNPFERPSSFGAGTTPEQGIEDPHLEGGPLLRAGGRSLSPPGVEPFAVEPLPGMGVSVTEQKPRPAGSQAIAGQPGDRGVEMPATVARRGSRPEVVLLSTIKGPRGYGAVIRVNESAAQVVQVGDVIEDGFRVTILTEDHAALSDGRETIVAKRPHP